ncbi:MAG: LysR family transcriptional regulator [Pseudomonadales bacterium]|nr:LysR family transcriptional regulator [Pseudomonadales bacterium]
MDIELLKTFLEVQKTRHFGLAAENLFLTQAAVSARIKQLERILGAPLFTRYRNNLQLTATGERLISHAEGMLLSWEKARQDLSLKKNRKVPLEIGAPLGLWDLILQERLPSVYDELKHVLLQAVSHGEETLIRRLMERRMDIALLYDAAKNSELLSIPAASGELILVSSEPDISPEDAINRNYIAVDWGLSFTIHQEQLFPDPEPPILHTSLARMALDFMQLRTGSAYLPGILLENGPGQALHRVAGAPVITRTVFAVYHRENRYSTELERIIDILRGDRQQAAVGVCGLSDESGEI